MSSSETEVRSKEVPPIKLKLGSKTMALLEGEHDVGRQADCWLTLEDEHASRHHARFVVKNERATVEDLGSRNGTFVNGQRLRGRKALHDGDEIRIGREVIAVISVEPTDDATDDLRRTLAPGEDAQFPELVQQLVDKSIKSGKLKDAERYALALVNQVHGSTIDQPMAEACIDCLIKLAAATGAGTWIDRLFALLATEGWLLDEPSVERVREVIDRVSRIPGQGLRDYERRLRTLRKEGVEVPARLNTAVAEMSDAYGEP